MRTKSILSTLIITAAVVITIGGNDASAGFPAPPGVPGVLIPPGLPGSNVNVRIDGYLPAPPGVHVLIDSGRPYYVERDRRVYIERERPSKHNKHYKKEKKHHEDNGNHYGEEKHGKHGKHDH